MSRKMLLLSSSFTHRANLAILAAACFAGTAAAEDTFPQAPGRVDVLRWLAVNSDLKADAIVTMTDEIVVAVSDRQDGRGADGSIRVALREEVINPEAAAAWGGRSIQLDLDLDCSRHRVILGARRIYASPNLQGSVRITRTDTAWTEAPPGTVVDDIVHAICAPAAPAAQIAAAEPTPAKAVVAALAPPPQAIAAASAPEPPPAAVPADRSMAPIAGPAARAQSPAAKAAAAIAPAGRPADFAVQIATVDSADLARDSWQSLKAKLPDLVAPRTFAVEPVTANGHTVYRALLLGFASPDEAAALCKALRGQSVDCTLRQMR